ncbi:type II toxin-antitoxin system HicA family toxin [Entomospira culicis]|uniref:Type II toxin-antitoxin system HicA family toxin n=1 Tax=Entomospira culicis TaxID=2719989 RepID=A0A968GHJ0_9SPIO|nr:type II toxin-antitoxin system HicA family toxin [Entomospira culicis]NIZ19985.1 type II toxin-antitoxin system HicA family toxin [Entomospira culicis]NIZ70213.1 type II toxin-antitoxin system HicA family toxin [Entomospira culicis]WDI38081.1 type II toxin-antitoxin system HicA family toxin [Entomospira culicis]WDI39704.1 type II toxin-antitoxin system HicA family toxin [Entomospira culicis]
MKYSELEKKLKALGYSLDTSRKGRGSHRYYIHNTTEQRLMIPWHRSKEVAKGTLASIKRATGLE